MPINNISLQTKLKVLMRLLNNNESFDIACSKSGLAINNAKKLLNNHKLNETIIHI